MLRRAYSAFQKPVYGVLAVENNARIIRPSGEHESDGTDQKELGSRFDPETLANKSAAPRMILMPESLANELNSLTRDSNPQELRQKASALYKSLAKGESHRPAFTSLEADAHIQATILQNYASISQVLHETKARLPDFNPKRVLDIGFGPATGLLVANELFPELERKVSVIFGHYRVRRRAQQLIRLQEADLPKEKATIFKQKVPASTATTKYDLVIATHQLYQSGPDSSEITDSHAMRLTNLLNPGGVLILIERGDAFGFESIARARQVIMRPEDSKNIKTQFVPRRLFNDTVGLRVVAPCSHQGVCPLQLGLTTRQTMKNPGSENWCRFSQNVHRPRFAMELKKGRYLAQEWIEDPEGEYGQGRGGKSLNGKGRPNSGSHEMATHSYIVIQRSEKLPASPEPEEPQPTQSPVMPTAENEQPPRIIRTPIKRRGHVIMEVSAPSGNIEHWTVTKSQGKQVYHDARKASHGDRWPLGAKSVQIRGGLSAKSKTLEKPQAEPAKKSGVDIWEQGDPDDDPISLLESGVAEVEDVKQNRSAKLDHKDRLARYREWSD